MSDELSNTPRRGIPESDEPEFNFFTSDPTDESDSPDTVSPRRGAWSDDDGGWSGDDGSWSDDDADGTWADDDGSRPDSEDDRGAWSDSDKTGLGEDPEVKTSLPVTAVPPPPRPKFQSEVKASRVADAAFPVAENPLARRSALSSATPPDFTAVPQRSANYYFDDDLDEFAQESPAEMQPRRKTNWLLIWIIGTILLALLIGIVVYTATRAAQQSAPVIPSPTATTSTSEDASRLSEAALLSPENAKNIAAVEWNIDKTETGLNVDSPKPACGTAELAELVSQVSLVRTLTSADNHSAGLHIVQEFTQEEDAIRAYQERLTALASCDARPTYLLHTYTTQNLADEAITVSVQYQDSPAMFHTIMLTRTKDAVNIFDFVNDQKPISPNGMLAGVSQVLSKQCQLVDGTCPKDPKIIESAPLATPPEGWLALSDLPRITTGSGRWTADEIKPVELRGSNCENLTLASANGPTKREQRTYLLTEDDQAPARFGLDEIVFDFPSAKEAAAFATRLNNNIKTCAERQETAKVSEPTVAKKKFTGTEEITSTGWDITQQTGDESTVHFQVAVATHPKSKQVVYLLANSSEKYRFAPEQFAEIGARAGQRLTG